MENSAPKPIWTVERWLASFRNLHVHISVIYGDGIKLYHYPEIILGEVLATEARMFHAWVDCSMLHTLGMV